MFWGGGGLATAGGGGGGGGWGWWWVGRWVCGGGGGLTGAIGGEATVGAATGRGGAAAGGGALGTGAGALIAGFTARDSMSVPLRLPNTLQLHAGRYLPRNLSIRGDSREPFGFLVSLRPVRRCAVCRHISVVR